uniref:Aminotransferase class I/classII large domain-containing protein n=1 Tax=Amphora coffeiformis TaxID=265554 RepID=A0A7S3P6A1_9STRA|mmetsp:Transcript_2130/g.4642  ORF Transcript_2130/g.4642 Transcript_2130/m.4642 type:complete len:497 (+) Transcript_2130:457-1947(+)
MQFKFIQSLALLRGSATTVRPNTRCYATPPDTKATSTTATTPTTTTTTRPVTLAGRLTGLNQPTVWHEFSPLAAQHGAVNLGQGFPDWQPPEFVLQAMERSLRDPRAANQYARSAAHLPLAEALVQDYAERWKNSGGSSIGSCIPMMDPTTQVATTVGCTNALHCAMQGLVNPGDQVILLEPAFDIYHAAVRMAGGTSVFCPLRPQPASDDDDDSVPKDANQVFTLDLDELEACITDRTKVFILNTPHNPTGKMFHVEELQAMADMFRRYPHVTILADEVYEHIVFDKETSPHVSMATLLWDQTLTLSSAGKTFSCTGWKVGWAVGPPHLVAAVSAVQQWTTFSVPTPTQDAVAQVLVQAREPYQGFGTYYDYLADLYKGKRDLLQQALETAGLQVVVPPGGFFIMADTSTWPNPPDAIRQLKTPSMPGSNMPRDWALARWSTETIGVTAIPPSAFYSAPNVPLARNYLRFAFCKQDETLREAQRRFAAYFGKPKD